MNGLCIRDLAKLTKGQLVLGDMPPIGGELEPVGRVVSDSRQVQPGDLFWGLVGRYCDGANFAEEAFLRGAAGVVVAGRHVEPWAGKFAIHVEDSNWALWQLARAIRRRFYGRIIAIAGNTGRSVTRALIHAVLRHSLTGTACQIDPIEKTALPFAMLSLEAEHDYAVLEMPLGAKGEIQSQSHLCDPRIGVITSPTNLSSSSLSPSEHLAVGQRELLTALPRDGWAVVSGDNAVLHSQLAKLSSDIIWTGCGVKNDVLAERVKYRNEELSFTIDRDRFRVPHVTRDDLPAALAAYAVGRIMELSPQEIASGLATFEGLENRCEMHRAQAGHLVVSDLADASLAASLSALEFVRDLPDCGRRIVVCGELENKDGRADDLGRRFGEAMIASCGIDWVFATGPQAEAIVAAARRAGLAHGRAVICESVAEVQRVLTDFVEGDDVVLVKGEARPEWQQLVKNLLAPDVRRTKVA